MLIALPLLLLAAPDPCAFAAELPEFFEAKRTDEDGKTNWAIPSRPTPGAVVVGSEDARALAAEAKDAAEVAVRTHRCVKELSNVLAFLMTVHHRESQKKHDERTGEVALDFYDAQRIVSRGGPDAYRFGFFRAELLYDLERWSEAADAYRSIVDADPRGEYLRTCAYNEVLTRARIARGGGPDPVRGALPTEPFQPRPKALSPAEQKLVETQDHYLKVVPSDPADAKLMRERRDVAFGAAWALLARDQPEGLRRLRALYDVTSNDDDRCEFADVLLGRLAHMDRAGLEEFLSDPDALHGCTLDVARYRKLLSDTEPMP